MSLETINCKQCKTPMGVETINGFRTNEDGITDDPSFLRVDMIGDVEICGSCKDGVPVADPYENITAPQQEAPQTTMVDCMGGCGIDIPLYYRNGITINGDGLQSDLVSEQELKTCNACLEGLPQLPMDSPLMSDVRERKEVEAVEGMTDHQIVNAWMAKNKANSFTNSEADKRLQERAVEVYERNK